VRAHQHAAAVEDEAIGRSRDRLRTKISIAFAALGNPVRFIFTAGQVADICQAEGLIDGFPSRM
jgi:hypothetical protein